MTTPHHGLPSKTLAEIHHVLADFPAVNEAILYGSRATGRFRPGSDIDLALTGPNLTATLLGLIRARFEESLIPYQIDLSLWDNIESVALREHIERVGVPLYRRSPVDTSH